MAKEDKEKKDDQPSRLQDKIEQALIDARRIFISDAVDDELAYDIIRKLWYLELSQPGKPILLIINSPGGSVDSGFAIYDQIHMITSPVITLVTGLAASFGSILSLAAGPGNRFATPNARIMIHQPLIGGVVKGQATDLEIQAREMLKTYNVIVDVYVQATGKTREQIEKALERNLWMTAEEALDFGLIDKIVTSYDQIKLK